MNDEWTILGIYSNRYEDALISIFNRWGEVVYQTSGGPSFEPWDGTNEGEELPVGTYYYVIDLNNSEDPQSGPITIVR